MVVIRTLLAISICFVSSVLKADEDLEKAIKEIQGEWKCERFANKGQELSKKELAQLTFSIKGNQIIATNDPKDPATIRLDITQKPTWFDMTDGSKETMLGIYELKDDTLTICSAEPKTPRPKKFASSKDSRTHLIILKRVKK
jgi:uncharacterized protein (TIGR03067 family)